MDLSPSNVLILRVSQFCCACLVYIFGGIIQVEKIGKIPPHLAVLKVYFVVPSAVSFNLFAVFFLIGNFSLVQGAFAIVSLVSILIGTRVFRLQDRSVILGSLLLRPLALVILDCLNSVFFLIASLLLVGSYTLGLYGSHKITCGDIDILANQPGTSLNGDQGAGEPAEALVEAIDFYNGLRLACRCRDAGIALGILGWLLWSITLGVGAYKLYKTRSAGGRTDDVVDDNIGTDVVVRSGELKGQ